MGNRTTGPGTPVEGLAWFEGIVGGSRDEGQNCQTVGVKEVRVSGAKGLGWQSMGTKGG